MSTQERVTLQAPLRSIVYTDLQTCRSLDADDEHPPVSFKYCRVDKPVLFRLLACLYVPLFMLLS